jgi:hypothetical protein
MTDHTAGNHADFSMASDVTGDAADDRALDASLCFGGIRKRDA